MNDQTECECGHLYDEHDAESSCTAYVDGLPCGCFHFDAKPPPEIPGQETLL